MAVNYPVTTPNTITDHFKNITNVKILPVAADDCSLVELYHKNGTRHAFRTENPLDANNFLSSDRLRYYDEHGTFEGYNAKG